LKNSVKFLFKVSTKLSRNLDNTRDSFTSVPTMQSSSSSSSYSFLACTTNSV